MKRPKAFNCYIDCIDTILLLSDNEAGELWKMLFLYAKNGESHESSSATVNLLFSMLSRQVDRDFEKYKTKVENGRKGGLAKAQREREEREARENFGEA